MVPMRFVTAGLEKQWDTGTGHGVPLHPKLVELVKDFSWHAFTEHGWLVEITSIVRTRDEDRALGASAVHVVGRAADIRTRSIPPQIVSACKAYIDKNWKYDKMRPRMTCCYIKPHGSGPHVHLQVHANTERIGDES